MDVWQKQEDRGWRFGSLEVWMFGKSKRIEAGGLEGQRFGCLASKRLRTEGGGRKIEDRIKELQSLTEKEFL